MGGGGQGVTTTVGEASEGGDEGRANLNRVWKLIEPELAREMLHTVHTMVPEV